MWCHYITLFICVFVCVCVTLCGVVAPIPPTPSQSHDLSDRSPSADSASTLISAAA